MYVHDYSGSSSTYLYESGAHVTFYGPDGSTIDIDVPTDDMSGQKYWLVACIDGSVGYSSITEINNIIGGVPGPDCPSF